MSEIKNTRRTLGQIYESLDGINIAYELIWKGCSSQPDKICLMIYPRICRGGIADAKL